MPQPIIFTEEQLANARTALEFDSEGNVRRSVFDSGTTLFLREQLTRIETDVVKQDFAPLDGLNLCPIEADLMVEDKFVKWGRQNVGGQAAFMTPSDTSVQNVNQGLVPEETRAHFIGVGYQVDIEELAAAQRYGNNLDAEGATLCQEAILDIISYSILDGNKPKNIKGFFGDKAVKGLEVAAISDASTADADLATLHAVVNDVATNNKNTIRPDTLAMGLGTYNTVATKRLSGRDRTVLEQFLASSPYIRSLEQVMAMPNLDATSAEQARMVAYQRSTSVVRCKLLPPRFHKIIELPFGYQVVWMAKMTDVNWKRPLGGRINRLKASA